MKYALIGLIVLSAPALPVFCAPASAQTTSPSVSPPSRMGRWEEFREREEQRIDRENDDELNDAEKARGGMYRYENKQAVLADFADCAVSQAPDRAAALLATVPATREEGLALRKLAGMDSCTRGRVFVSARTGEMRGALAEAALTRDAAKLAALNARAVATPTRIAERAAGTRPFVIAYGQCLAAAAPVQSVSLIGTAHGSDDEKRAIIAIGEPLKACMPEGVAYSLNIRDVRNHVADALYRMSENPSA